MVIRFQHMDTFERTRENDTIDTAQNAAPHYPNKKKIQKEDTSQQRGKREKKREGSGKAGRKERRGRNE